jgi:hypothetical protein
MLTVTLTVEKFCAESNIPVYRLETIDISPRFLLRLVAVFPRRLAFVWIRRISPIGSFARGVSRVFAIGGVTVHRSAHAVWGSVGGDILLHDRLASTGRRDDFALGVDVKTSARGELAVGARGESVAASLIFLLISPTLASDLVDRFSSSHRLSCFPIFLFYIVTLGHTSLPVHSRGHPHPQEVFPQESPETEWKGYSHGKPNKLSPASFSSSPWSSDPLDHPLPAHVPIAARFRPGC